jgi:phthiodiolone/phenolphthiodiolone dimycocerosates ketoreductase
MGIISQHTEKIRLGVGVTDPHRRNPALLAQTAVTVDIASNGRLIMGIGAGEAMNLEPFGIPWNRPVSRMAEAMPLMQRLWSERYVDHEGEFYSMHNAIVEPKPVQKPHPPMWLAANGPRTLRLCGEHCQGWLPGRINPSTYADDLDVIRSAARDSGADWSLFEPGLWTNSAIADSREEALKIIEKGSRRVALFMPQRFQRLGLDIPEEHSFLTMTVSDSTPSLLEKAAEQVPFEAVADTIIFGTVDDCIGKIQEFVDAGARHIVVGNSNPQVNRDGMWERYGNEIMPSFR